MSSLMIYRNINVLFVFFVELSQWAVIITWGFREGNGTVTARRESDLDYHQNITQVIIDDYYSGLINEYHPKSAEAAVKADASRKRLDRYILMMKHSGG